MRETADSIHFTCPVCSATRWLDRSLAGTTMTCETCGDLVRIPNPPKPDHPETEDPPALPSKRWWTTWKARGWMALAGLAFYWFSVHVPVREERHRDASGDRRIVEKNLWGTPLHKWIFFADGGSMHGALTSSGKWHGRWVQLHDHRLYEYWYWYGETVSEGRWRELNR
jgi:hypothetical protein